MTHRVGRVESQVFMYTTLTRSRSEYACNCVTGRLTAVRPSIVFTRQTNSVGQVQIVYPT